MCAERQNNAGDRVLETTYNTRAYNTDISIFLRSRVRLDLMDVQSPPKQNAKFCVCVYFSGQRAHRVFISFSNGQLALNVSPDLQLQLRYRSLPTFARYLEGVCLTSKQRWFKHSQRSRSLPRQMNYLNKFFTYKRDYFQPEENRVTSWLRTQECQSDFLRKSTKCYSEPGWEEEIFKCRNLKGQC